jgi:Rrf2 family iron-responsive transcriptional regulator
MSSHWRHIPAQGTAEEFEMRLTRQTNYAVRILMYCAANDGKLSRIPAIAEAYGVSELFLFKILQPLVENGMIETVRGRNGGVRLARPAARITLLDVVRVTEDNFAMAECFENDAAECPLVDGCALNEALRKALGAFFDVLEGYSIDDLVRTRPMRSLLGIEFGAPAAFVGQQF